MYFSEFFLEDIIEMIKFQPNTDIKKQKRINKINKEENCNLIVSDDYPEIVRERVAIILEDDQHLELVEALLAFIDTNPNESKRGAVLIFLPGWDWIMTLKDFLLKKKQFGILNCVLCSSLPYLWV